MKIAVLGAGAWGSALAISLSAQHALSLWTRNPADCESLARDRASRYLPGATLPDAVRIECDLGQAVRDSELVIVATATSGLRDTSAAVCRIIPEPALIWACKGFETSTGALPHQIVAQVLPGARRVAALSGPSFALEVALRAADRRRMRVR